jgi:outer membrane murein-binding lipoprotein Lpp
MFRYFAPLAVLVVLALGTGTAQATVYPGATWSNDRLSWNVRELNQEVSRLQYQMRAVRPDVQDAIRLANEAYDASAYWTLELIECMRMPDPQEDACLDEAIANGELPEEYIVDSND